MTYNIQEIFGRIGAEGCYFLCLGKAAGVLDNEVLFYYETFIQKGFLEQDCFVNDPVAILRYLGVPVTTVEKSKTLKDGKIICARYKYMNHRHFVLVDRYGNIIFDPLGESNTVKKGQVEDYRIFR